MKEKVKITSIQNMLFFFENYIQTNILLKFISYLIVTILYYIIFFIQIICLNGSIIFANYSLLLLGHKPIKWNKQFIFAYLLQFTVLLIISIIIGIPRLYIIWFLQAIIESYKIFNLEDQLTYRKENFAKFNIFEKFNYTYTNWGKIIYLLKYYERKYQELDNIYEKPYHTFFMFDLCKFISNGKADTKYSQFCGGRSYGEEEQNEFFPIIRVYKFYNWEELAKGYIQSANSYWVEYREYDEKRDKIIRIAEALIWIDLINKDNDYLKILVPDIEITEEEKNQAYDLLKLKFYGE